MFFLFKASGARWRGSGNTSRAKNFASSNGVMMNDGIEAQIDRSVQVNWQRILLLIIAITVHNIPGQ